MNRLLALVVLVLFAGAAVADVPPPPPPKGKKYVTVSNEVKLGKDVTGYVFVKQVIRVPGGNKNYSKLELGTEKATAIPEPERRVFVTLFAVPQDAVKEFKTDDELFAALGNNKVKGAQHIYFSVTGTVSDTVKSNSVKWTFPITGIDEKGIQTKVDGEGYEPPPEKPKKNSGKDSDEGDSPADDTVAPASAPRGGTLIAGMAGFGAVALGGLWLAGRARRKA